MREYEGESASTDEFIALASRVAHRNLGPFLRDWLYGSKTPPMPGHPDWTVNEPGAEPRGPGGAQGADRGRPRAAREALTGAPGPACNGRARPRER